MLHLRLHVLFLISCYSLTVLYDFSRKGTIKNVYTTLRVGFITLANIAGVGCAIRSGSINHNTHGTFPVGDSM